MTDDDTFHDMMKRPATREELLQLAGLIHLALLSQTSFGASLIGGDEAQQREFGEKTVEHASTISRAMRAMIERWEQEA